MKRAIRKLPILILLMLTLMSLLPPRVHAQIQASFFGMGVNAARDLPKVSYGISSHPPLAWSLVEGTARGVYAFSKLDPYVNAAPKDANGVAQIDIVLGWTPGWAVAVKTNCRMQEPINVQICTVPPDNLQDWTDFVSAVAAHYNGVNAPEVRYYEIWCEANTRPFWTSSVAALVQMAQLAYPILKQNPHALVFTPSVTWTGGQNWMTNFLSGGGSAVADGVSFHGYPSQTGKGVKLPIPLPGSPSSTNAPIQAMAHQFRVIANANGMAGKPLITTEGGWGVGGVLDPDMQAAWIAQYEILQAGVARAYNLQFQTWFTWGHAPSGTIETTQGTPTEAGWAYNEVTQWLTGTMPTPCSNSGNIWSCPVGSNLVVWDASQICNLGVCTTSLYTAPSGFVQYVDLTGKTNTIAGQIALGVKPILLQP